MTSYQFVKEFAELILRNSTDRTEDLALDDIRDAVQRACDGIEQMHEREDTLSREDKDNLIRELEGQYQTVISEVRVLVGKDDDGWNPWLPERSGSIAWAHWDRYKKHLRNGPMGETVLGRLTETTEKAMGYLGDPKSEASWDRRGLVVGLVQSGKTSHYIGLVNRALDSGYRVIVILTGFTDSLRVQTQIRTEEGCLGYYVDKDNSRVRTGVGTINPAVRPDSVTTRRTDFPKTVAQNFQIGVGNTPLIFVVKKNASILNNLINWIKNFGNAKDEDRGNFVKGVPFLLIDDESDVGSIDTKAGAVVDKIVDMEHNPTTINRHIRTLLHLFDQSSYVGYTATPFANVLIHDDGRTQEHGGDLFPRSFIMSLPTPSDHVGPLKIFGRETEDGDREEGLPLTRTIPAEETWNDSQEDKERRWINPVHKKDWVPLWEGREEIPPSLWEALLSFILVCAARRIRQNGTKHNSMLIHVTRFTAVQEKVGEQVRQALQGIKDRLGLGTADGDLLRQLKELWTRDFTWTTKTIASKDGVIYQNQTHAWENIYEELLNAAASIQVRNINGYAKEELEYEDHETTGLNVIAIGGDKLSRGLTLEGLSVSYFQRSSRMYDTLMQMGRWFGYRHGYLDLCRLYTTTSLLDSFSHIADATEELRRELDQMDSNGGTPADYGLRIRSHPALMVTSQVKMRHGWRTLLTFHGKHIETNSFSRDTESVKGNWDRVKQLVQTLESDEDGTRITGNQIGGGSAAWNGVSADAVTRFLGDYEISNEGGFQFQPEYLKEYIEKENLRGRLTDWTVLISGKRTGKLIDGDDKPGESTDIRTVTRGWPVRLKDEKKDLITKGLFRTGILKSRSDEWFDMPPGTPKYEEALELTKTNYRENPGRRRTEPKVPDGIFVRQLRDETKGLLIIYPIEANPDNSEEKESGAGSTPLTGCLLSFPSVKNAAQVSQVEYVVNNRGYEEEQLALFGPN